MYKQVIINPRIFSSPPISPSFVQAQSSVLNVSTSQNDLSQLIRYARACSSYECFILRATRLSNKLLEQGYVKERLKSSLRKFYGRYGDLIKQYEVSLSQMLHDILWPDHIQWQHLTDQTLYRTRPFTEFWVVSIEYLRRVWHADRGRLLLRTPGPVPYGICRCSFVETTETQSYITPVYDTFPDLTFYRPWRYYSIKVSIGHLQRVWHADRGRLLLRTPGPVPLGLAYILLVETNSFPNLSLFYRTMLFEYPSVRSRFYLIQGETDRKQDEENSLGNTGKYFEKKTTKNLLHVIR